jgi:DNA polymerase-1
MRDRCAGCPYLKPAKGFASSKPSPVIPGSGPCSNGIVIVGEAPGVQEAQQGKPFVGMSGRLLRQVLTACGIDPDQAFITNAVACHPPGNKTPSLDMIRSCRENLLREITEQGPTKVLSLGGTALTALSGGKKRSITKVNGLGSWLDLEDTRAYWVPTLHPAAILRESGLFRDFAESIQKFAANTAPHPQPSIEWEIARTYEGTAKALMYLQEASVVSCDLETTGLDPLKDTIISIGFGALGAEPNTGYSLILPRETVHMSGSDGALVRWEVANFFSTFKGMLVFHNIKFDTQFLTEYLGSPPEYQRVSDTMYLKYAQDERPGGQVGIHKLKTLAQVRYDVEDYSFDFDAFYALPDEERDYESLYQYHAIDCWATAQAFVDLGAELCEESPKLIDLVDRILVPGAIAFSQVELNGCLIDRKYLESEEEKILEELEEMKGHLADLARQFDIPDFNPNSYPQALKFVQGVTGFAVTSTDKETVMMAKTRVDPVTAQVLDDLLEYRLFQKVLSTYIRGILRGLDKNDRLHPDFFIHGTATGRLSCHDPNLQNIPVIMGNRIRHAFIVPDDSIMIEADYSQLELRILALLCQDPELIRVFQDKRDIHKEVAAKMFKKLAELVSDFERYMAKYVDFGIIYGRQAKALTEGFEMDYFVKMGGTRWTVPEAQQFLDELMDGFPGMKRWIETQHQIVLRQKYVEGPLGMRRRFPFIGSQAEVSGIQRQAVNSPIQGTAGQLGLWAVTQLTQKLPIGAHVFNTVHDSIMTEGKTRDRDQIIERIYECMETNLPFECNVPIVAELKEGQRWSELKHINR